MADNNPSLYNLRWNNHNMKIINGLQRLHEKEIFCDTKIVCEGKHYPVHRVILSICSEYFNEIFHEAPCEYPFIILKGIQTDDFEALLDFMYKGEVNIPEERLESFIETGRLFKMRELFISDEDEDEDDQNEVNSERSSDEAFSPSIEEERRDHSTKDRIQPKRKNLCSLDDVHPVKRMRNITEEQEKQLVPNNKIGLLIPVKEEYESKLSISESTTHQDLIQSSDSDKASQKSTYLADTEFDEIVPEELLSLVENGSEDFASSLSNLDVIIKEEMKSFDDVRPDFDGAASLPGSPDALGINYTANDEIFPDNLWQYDGFNITRAKNDYEAEGMGYSSPIITVRCSYNTPDKRSYIKQQYCAYCGKGFTNLSKHLLRHHSRETEIKVVLALPLNSQERKFHLERIRNIGNYRHNCSVIRNGYGEIIPWRCPTIPVNHLDYVPCQYCYAFFYKKELWKHNKNCKFRPESHQSMETHSESETRKLIFESRFLVPARESHLKGLQEKVLSQMVPDTFTALAKDDFLITEFGVKRYEKLSHLPHQYQSISQKMRELAKLLFIVKGMDSHVEKLSDIIDPTKFNVLTEAIQKLGGYSGNDSYETPSVTSKVASSLYYCSFILKMMYIGERDTKAEMRCDAFIDLYREELKTKKFLP